MSTVCLTVMVAGSNALITSFPSILTKSRIQIQAYNRYSSFDTRFWTIDNDDGGSSEDFQTNDFTEADLQTAGVVIEDLNWRVEKLRLEEQNKNRFLKAKPRFLPYDECRKWVQAFDRWHTKEEWRNWIRMGEKRNAYIPSRPDEYYGERGEWISWVSSLASQVKMINFGISFLTRMCFFWYRTTSSALIPTIKMMTTKMIVVVGKKGANRDCTVKA